MLHARLSFSLALLIACYCFTIVAGCTIAKQQRGTYSARLDSLPSSVRFPQDLEDKINYDKENKRLTFKGVMTEEERDKLRKLSRNVQYTAAVTTLYHGSQKNTKGRDPSSYETDPDSRTGVLKGASRGTTKDVRGKAKPKTLARQPQEGREKSSARITGFEGEEKIDPTEKRALRTQTSSNEENANLVRTVAAQIVTELEEKFPPTKGNDFTVLIQPFTTLDGKQTMLSYLLAEELFTLLSNSPWVGDSLKICCNPIDGGPTPKRLDGIISGSLIQLGEEIRINARLLSADNHIILAAISTKIPASEIARELLETQITPKEPIESGDLNRRLDSLVVQVEEVLHDLQGDKEGVQRLCILDFRTLGDEKNLLGSFLVEEFTLKLSKNKSWKFVPSTRIEGLLGRQVSSVSGFTTKDLKKLAGELGIQVVIEGTVMDLGNDVKVNVKVADTVEGLIWGTASVDIPTDKRVKYLLNKETWGIATSSGSGNLGVAKEGLKATYPKQKELISVISGEVDEFFLNEDFSGPEVVNRLPEWGEDLIVTNEGGKHFLASLEPGFIKIGKEVNFSANFSLEFEVKGSSKYWNTLTFTDTSGNEFGMDFQINEGNCYIVLPGPKSVRTRVDTNSSNRFKLVRTEGFYEIYVNDTLTLAGPYSKYTTFKSFTITARLDQVRFADFRGKEIKS